MNQIVTDRYEIHLGEWQEALAGVEGDLLFADLPFSKRVHDGHNKVKNLRRKKTRKAYGMSKIGYEPMTHKKVMEFVRSWHPRIRGWIVCFCSHDLWPSFEEAFNEVGRYAFPPVPCIISGMTCRMSGDGPSSETVFMFRGTPAMMIEVEETPRYLMVARPRTKEMAHWGTLPGKYDVPRGKDAEGGRGKPHALIKQILRDYSRPDNVVVDATMGFGGVGVAALEMGRRFVGADIDPLVFQRAAQALDGVPVPLIVYDPSKAKQVGIFEDVEELEARPPLTVPESCDEQRRLSADVAEAVTAGLNLS